QQADRARAQDPGQAAWRRSREGLCRGHRGRLLRRLADRDHRGRTLDRLHCRRLTQPIEKEERDMPAYLVAQVRVDDPERYRQYTSQVPALVAKHGGRFLVRGPQIEVLEGSHDGRRFVIIEFPSMAHVKAFHDAPEYQPLIELRQSASLGDLWAVPGV